MEFSLHIVCDYASSLSYKKVHNTPTFEPRLVSTYRIDIILLTQKTDLLDHGVHILERSKEILPRREVDVNAHFTALHLTSYNWVGSSVCRISIFFHFKNTCKPRGLTHATKSFI